MTALLVPMSRNEASSHLRIDARSDRLQAIDRAGLRVRLDRREQDRRLPAVLANNNVDGIAVALGAGMLAERFAAKLGDRDVLARAWAFHHADDRAA